MEVQVHGGESSCLVLSLNPGRPLARVGKTQVRPGTVRNDLATLNVSSELSQEEPGDSRGEQQLQQQQ